jgi:hypothetical protein
LLPNLISDQERIWSFPARLVQGQSWIPTAAVLGTTAGLMTRDPSEAAYFHGTSSFRGFNNIFTGNATVVGTSVAPASLYVIGLVRKDAKMQRTALLAGEAVARRRDCDDGLEGRRQACSSGGLPGPRKSL